MVSRSAGLAILVMLGTGCGSLSPLGTARNLNPGQMVWSSAVSFMGTPIGREDVPANSSQIEVGFSAGITKRFKLQLIRAKTPNSGVDLALAPRVAFQQLGTSAATWEAASTHLAIMLGINFPGGNQIVLSPQVGGLFLLDRGTKPVDVLQVGASIGFAWKVARCITLMPNVTFLYSTLHMDGREDVWFYRVSLLFMLGERG